MLGFPSVGFALTDLKTNFTKFELSVTFCFQHMSRRATRILLGWEGLNSKLRIFCSKNLFVKWRTEQIAGATKGITDWGLGRSSLSLVIMQAAAGRVL